MDTWLAGLNNSVHSSVFKTINSNTGFVISSWISHFHITQLSQFKALNIACLPNCSCRPCSIRLKRQAVLPPSGRKQLLHLNQAQNKNDILFQQMRYQDPNWEIHDWHRLHSRNTHWAWAFVKVWPAAIISARRATAGSNIRLAAATTSSPLPVKAHINLGNLSARVDCTITIQCCPLDVKRQEFPFVHFAFIYHFCESFPVAWKKKTVESWMLQHQMWRLHFKTTYDGVFFSEYLCIWCFSQPTPSKKKGRTQFLWVSAACSAQQPALRSNNRRNQQAWNLLFYLWRNITRSNIQGLYNLACLLPWACDICQCPTLHLWSPRMVRGKAVTSPAPNMSGMFVLMNCQAGQTPEGQQQTH